LVLFIGALCINYVRVPRV